MEKTEKILVIKAAGEIAEEKRGYKKYCSIDETKILHVKP